jgi:hypothetical protein
MNWGYLYDLLHEVEAVIILIAIARNFLFQPLGSLPAEGPGSEGVRLLYFRFLIAAIRT